MGYFFRVAAHFVVLLVLIGLSGCASIPMASPEQDAEAKKFEPPDSMAGVYLFRVDTHASGILVPVGIDGKYLGKTSAFSYFYWKIPAGRHKIITGGMVPRVYELTVKSGSIYFLRQNVFFDNGYNSALIDVETKDGKQQVMRCKLAASVTQPAKTEASTQNNDTKLEDLKGLLQLKKE